MARSHVLADVSDQIMMLRLRSGQVFKGVNVKVRGLHCMAREERLRRLVLIVIRVHNGVIIKARGLLMHWGHRSRLLEAVVLCTAHQQPPFLLCCCACSVRVHGWRVGDPESRFFLALRADRSGASSTLSSNPSHPSFRPAHMSALQHCLWCAKCICINRSLQTSHLGLLVFRAASSSARSSDAVGIRDVVSLQTRRCSADSLTRGR